MQCGGKTGVLYGGYSSLLCSNGIYGGETFLLCVRETALLCGSDIGLLYGGETDLVYGGETGWIYGGESDSYLVERLAIYSYVVERLDRYVVDNWCDMWWYCYLVERLHDVPCDGRTGLLYGGARLVCYVVERRVCCVVGRRVCCVVERRVYCVVER